MDFRAKNNNLRATMGGVSHRGTRWGTLTGPLMAMAAVLVCSPLLLYPPGRDQSVFLLAGRALAGGAIPYRDFWDIKPPGLFLAYLVPGTLAAAWPGAAALVDLAALAVAVLACHRLLSNWGAAPAGPAAAIFLSGLWAFAGDWWDLGQGERLAIPLLILALLAAGLGQVELAENDLRRIIADQPDNAAAINALGYTLADLTDRYDEAEQLIFLAYELQPGDASIIDSMGWISYRRGRLVEAEKYLREAWKLLRNAEIAAHLGEVLWASGQKDEARAFWKLGVEMENDNEILVKTMQRFGELP